MDILIIPWHEFLDACENSNPLKSVCGYADGCLLMKA